MPYFWVFDVIAVSVEVSELFENYFGYYGRTNGLVDAFDEQRAIHHQFVA